jgi:hypothetical protein
MPTARPAVVPFTATPDPELAHARELLGADADGLSDADVRRACDAADALAHIIVRMFRDPERRP